MRDETIIKIVAIVSLFVLEAFALWKGIDSKLLLTIGAIIGGIAGYEIGALKGKILK